MRLVFASNRRLHGRLACELWASLLAGPVGNSPALPHGTDQQFVVLAVWGVLVPTIWGFNSRWLPIFLGPSAAQ